MHEALKTLEEKKTVHHTNTANTSTENSEPRVDSNDNASDSQATNAQNPDDSIVSVEEFMNYEMQTSQVHLNSQILTTQQ